MVSDAAMKIKRIGPKSLGKVLGLTYAFFNFLGGLFFLANFALNQCNQAARTHLAAAALWETEKNSKNKRT